MKKYIHIGYPKNLSTTLQRDFFSKHFEILHLGVGCNEHNLGYINDEIRIAIEMHLRYSKNSIYVDKQKEIKKFFELQFKQAQEKKYKAVGISCEHFSFNFTPDNIDITQKAQRLYDIFGDETKIIIITRNQPDLIKSLYSECIRIGYPYGYYKFIEYCYFYKERNFISDFQYDKVFNTYAELFGEKNIMVVPLEEVIDESSREILQSDSKYIILQKICSFINLNYDSNIQLGHFNKKLDESVAVIKRDLNSNYPHDLGNIIYSGAETNRLWKYYEKELNIEMPYEAQNDVLQKQKLIKMAENESLTRNLDLKIDYNCDPELEKRLYDFFSASNKKFQKLINKNLASMRYPL